MDKITISQKIYYASVYTGQIKISRKITSASIYLKNMGQNYIPQN